MRAGADVIYQATFLRSPFRGHADFLFRVERPSELGDWSYEVADAKLARRAKPYFLVQLCFYSELLHGAQGGEAPERVHVILGDGDVESFRLAEFSAYFRRVRERYLAALDDGAETYPEPVVHCAVCRWSDRCDAQRAADDHLSLVANIYRRHRDLLGETGITTLEALGRLDPAATVAGIRPEQLGKLRQQAALQLRTRETGEPALEFLDPVEARGFARLPKPSEGDVFFDMEGDPFFELGLEYLFGFVTHDRHEPDFTGLWGRTRAEERRALEDFIDFVVARRERWPDLHVYHYAHYEITALTRLAGQHGTREDELDQLLRDEVFVDLLKVVREAMRIGQPSYGLKKVEAFYMDQRKTSITDGNESVIEFERWLDQGGVDGGDPAILEEVAAYNRDDCLSTLRLRDWLLAERERCEGERGVQIAWFERETRPPGEAAQELADETGRLISALCDGLPDEPGERDSDEQARWLLAQLLDYHRREARPVWWAFYARIDGEIEALVDDPECVGALETGGEPVPEKRSLAYPMRFPVQETKLGSGREARDGSTGESAGTILSIEPERGRLVLKRGPILGSVPLPQGLIPGGPYNTNEQRAALRRLANAALGGEERRYGACFDLLHRRPPRVRGREAGAPLYEGAPDFELLRDLVSSLESSYLVIQGPPGAGKTYTGARLITHLIREGNRVGVTSTSHKAIHNMLREVESVASEERLGFRGLKKSSADNPESVFESDHIESVHHNSALTDQHVGLPAGTAWHFCRDEVDGTLDYLFVDEAGQVSLADALALGTAAHNLILLGDPQQLPQVTQAAHPPGSALSALEHVLGDRQTIPPEDGVFLEETWRMHPDVTAYVSELMYEGRLRSAPGRELQRIVCEGLLGGTGIRWLPTEHEGNSQSSQEEARAIVDLIDSVESARFVDCDGTEHDLRREDIMVVTPYNAQVRCLERALPAGVRIGTVDKFQGQEAQLVFFSLATSSAAEIPRSLEFLLSRNRLNVAVSRARCVAAVVASPALLEIDCTSIEQMRLINALCRVVERASCS
jgi:predicted RecB family nuclease